MFKLQALLVIGMVMYCVCVHEALADCAHEGKTFKIDESFKPENECMQMTCKGTDQWEAVGCAAFGTPANCKVIAGDLTKPYPDCCDRPVCE